MSNWPLLKLALLSLTALSASVRASAVAPGPLPSLYVSPGGSDGNPGTSQQLPFRTVGKALAGAGPGTTIFLQAGAYYEQIVTRRGGEAGAPITIRSLDGQAIIDGSRLKWRRASDQNQGLVEIRHPFVRLIGLGVVGSPNTGILLDADDISIENCRVADAQLHGISTLTDRQTSYKGRSGTMIRRITLQGNLVERVALAQRGQAISLIADGFLVSGNTVRNSLQEGIDIWLGARRGEVVDNVVQRNQAAGIYIDGASQVRIHRNRVYRNGSGIGVSSEDVNYRTDDILVDTNVVYDNRGSGIFLWDQAAGHQGVQNVALFHNALVGNRYAFYLAGVGNTARFLNNLGFSRGLSVRDDSKKSSFVMRGNVWLRKPIGFVSAARKDFHLTRQSPAIDKGPSLPDAAGERWSTGSDFAGTKRPIGSHPDAGAFEYSGAD